MSNWEYKNFEEKMTTHIDTIYNSLFSNVDDIERSNNENFKKGTPQSIMDQYLGIDTTLHFNNGSIITIQEKTRKAKWIETDEFTFEYYNNKDTGLQGEWFHMGAQIYFYGFANEEETDYHHYYILDIAMLRLWLSKYSTKQLKEKFEYHRNNGYDNADFFAIKFSDIPKKCFLTKADIDELYNVDIPNLYDRE